MSYRDVGFRSPRRAWLVTVGLVFGLVSCTILLKEREVEICEEVDAALDGCFVHVAGWDSGWMSVRKTECNEVEGEAHGLSELGPPPGDAWVFSGSIATEPPPDAAGRATLDATWDGGLDEQTLEAIHRVTPEERLILRHQGAVEVQVELERCP